VVRGIDRSPSREKLTDAELDELLAIELYERERLYRESAIWRATFSYPASSDVVIRIALPGCRTVAGPYLPVRIAISSGGARLVAKLERLVA
jgi:hypothetical protein